MSLLSFRPSGFDMAWIAAVLCGLPMIAEAFIGLVISFDIKADVRVSMVLSSVAVFLALTGMPDPVFGAIVHNAGPVPVMTNPALRLKRRMRKTASRW